MGHLYGCVVTTLLCLNRLICLCQSQVYNTWRILPSLSFSNYTLLLPWGGGGGGGDIFYNYVLLKINSTSLSVYRRCIHIYRIVEVSSRLELSYNFYHDMISNGSGGGAIKPTWGSALITTVFCQ